MTKAASQKVLVLAFLDQPVFPALLWLSYLLIRHFLLTDF